MATKLSDLIALRKNFAVFSRRGCWSIECFECDAKFSILKKNDLTTNWLAYILNHTTRHPKQSPPPESEPEPQPVAVKKAPAEISYQRRPREELF